METNFEVRPLEVLEVREYAKIQRRHLGWAEAERVDPLSLEEVSEIWTIHGMKPFRLEFAAKEDLPVGSSLATYDGSNIAIKLPARIRQKALLGEGSARFAIARELGHATLHLSELMAADARPRREAAKMGETQVGGRRSARWQARTFAAALLIRDETIWNRPSFEEISIQTGVDLLAAKLYLDLVHSAVSRPAPNDRLQKIANELRREMVVNSLKPARL
jgi:hypothetical protein